MFGGRELFFILNMVMVTGKGTCVRPHELYTKKKKNPILLYINFNISFFPKERNKPYPELLKTPRENERERTISLN